MSERTSCDLGDHCSHAGNLTEVIADQRAAFNNRPEPWAKLSPFAYRLTKRGLVRRGLRTPKAA